MGGVDRYFFDLADLFKKKGDKIAFFSMQSNLNRKSIWSKYFVSNVSYENQDILSKLKFTGRLLYSREAKNKINELLEVFKPEIVHIQSIYHQISPSVISEIKKRNIPMVQSIGDFHLVAPNYNLFHSGKICETTKPNKFYKAYFHKCVKGSYFASFIEVFEKYLHYYLGWERNYIDYFIVPSQFTRNKLIEYGLGKEKIIYLPHFIEVKPYAPNYFHGNYSLYFGRLSEEKGLFLLLDVMNMLPHVQLKIVGRGPQEKRLKEKIKLLKLKNVQMCGFLDGYKLKKIIEKCRFTILPSIWYEVFGLSILESFACGKPVIASDIGGIPELIRDGYNGFLFKPGDAQDLIRKIINLWDNPDLNKTLGKNAREFTRKNFNPEVHYEKLFELYKQTLKRHY